jgi:hypothetical protein
LGTGLLFHRDRVVLLSFPVNESTRAK